MFSIIGIVVVFGCVVAGYLMEHGNLKVLMQPAELIIILGAAIGTVLIANPLHILTKIGGGLGGAFGGSAFDKQRYLCCGCWRRSLSRAARNSWPSIWTECTGESPSRRNCAGRFNGLTRRSKRFSKLARRNWGWKIAVTHPDRNPLHRRNAWRR
jgi:hypothetical protein